MCTACHTLITGSQAVVVQRRLMFFPGCIEEALHKATAKEQGHRVFTAFTKRLFEVALKEIWSCNNFAGGAATLPQLWWNWCNVGRFWRSNRRRGGRQEAQMGSEREQEQNVHGGGWERTGERLPPALSQPHGWLWSPLIVIADQTRPTAATNISCSIWPTCTLTYRHTRW